MDTVALYQFKITLRSISPMIWRRVLTPSDTTIAQMHAIVQALMDWSGQCLHRFHILGKDYGIAYLGGISFGDDPHQVRLVDFRLRPGERFLYEYDFISNWLHDVRLEKIVPAEPEKSYPSYPVGIGGARATPPEWLPGPGAYMRWLQARSSWGAMMQLQDDVALVAGRLRRFLEGEERPTCEDEEFAQALDRMEQRLDTDPELFHRRPINTALRKLAKGWAENAVSDPGQGGRR